MRRNVGGAGRLASRTRRGPRSARSRVKAGDACLRSEHGGVAAGVEQHRPADHAQAVGISSSPTSSGDRIVVEHAGRFRKSDEIKSVRITLGDDSLEAQVEGASVRCSIGHSSGGVRIRSEQVGMDVWLTRLLATLQSEAAHSEQTRLALENIVIGGQSGRVFSCGLAAWLALWKRTNIDPSWRRPASRRSKSNPPVCPRRRCPRIPFRTRHRR